MSSSEPKPKLLVVEVIEDRATNPLYQHVVTHFTKSFLVAASKNWQLELVGADDLGKDELLNRADEADAVVILGGEDVHPKFSNQPEDYPGAGNHYEVADEAQIALVQHAEKTGQPLLGICRGSQIINVALGGTLVQHIEDGSHRNANLVHDLTLVTHPVHIVPGTKIAEALASEVVHGVVSVQSSHHQAADKLGEQLQVSATALDGIIEAFEHKSKPIYAVQWHPEDPNVPADQLHRLLALLDER